MAFQELSLEPGSHILITTPVGVVEVNLSQQTSLSVAVSVKGNADLVSSQHYPPSSDGALESWHIRLARKP